MFFYIGSCWIIIRFWVMGGKWWGWKMISVLISRVSGLGNGFEVSF